MAKKNFKDDNPAIQFISSANNDQVALYNEAEIQEEKKPKKRKKSSAEQTIVKVNGGYKFSPPSTEKKSRRVQLVLKPSLYEKIKAQADANGISFNNYCHLLLEEFAGKE